MTKMIARLLIKWIVVVTTMICYQSNIFPHDQIGELDRVSDDLIRELEKI